MEERRYTCRQCHQTKAAGEFYHSDHYWCRKCRQKHTNEYMKGYRQRPEVKKRLAAKRHRCYLRHKKTKVVDWYRTIGGLGEVLGAKVLRGAIVMPFRWRYDLEWQGKKVEVKTASPMYNYDGRGSVIWRFNTKQKGEVDYFLFIGLDENHLVSKVFLIPDGKVTLKRMGISPNSCRFSEYRIDLGALGMGF